MPLKAPRFELRNQWLTRIRDGPASALVSTFKIDCSKPDTYRLVALTYLVDSPAGHRLMEILNFIASTECRRTRETEEQTSAAVYVRDSATRP